MGELIVEKNFNEMVKYHNQVGGYLFGNIVGDFAINVECCKGENFLRVWDDVNDNYGICTFSFDELTFEKLKKLIEMLKKVLQL